MTSPAAMKASVDSTLARSRFEIPKMPGANTAILFQAQAAGNNAEIKQLVMKAGAPPAPSSGEIPRAEA